MHMLVYTRQINLQTNSEVVIASSFSVTW